MSTPARVVFGAAPAPAPAPEPAYELPNLRTTITIHEASHAVVMLRCGWPVRYITLAPRLPGRAAHVAMPRGSRLISAWDEIAVFAAGAIGHDLLTAGRDRKIATAGAWHDFEQMRAAACWIRDDVRAGQPSERGLTRRATVRQIAEVGWDQAYRMVLADWGAILIIADALRDRPTLHARDIRRFLDRAAPAVPPAPALTERFWPRWEMPKDWWTHQAAAGG